MSHLGPILFGTLLVRFARSTESLELSAALAEVLLDALPTNSGLEEGGTLGIVRAFGVEEHHLTKQQARYLRDTAAAYLANHADYGRELGRPAHASPVSTEEI